jgi:hypothetical protein
MITELSKLALLAASGCCDDDDCVDGCDSGCC